ncbi:hypothetical protein GJ744_002858 [Endocarpon pusillum]|uniref:Peptidase S1 domain-containing protein n=1 Tax=Endocarpon pusillum TaxID=364733 RepID=A0A8H7A7Q6_9EURO|nr:hypothetical protein GJ744_002858 [Endocarpon pusillum]
MTTSTNPPSSTFMVPEQTYWKSLSESDRRECVNKDISRSLGDKTGWAYTGVLKRKWNDEVYPAISLIINNKENYEKVFRKANTRLTRPCSLYMVGEAPRDPNDKPWERAQPTIVAISSKLRIAQKLCKLLKKSECLRNMSLGFDFMCFEDKKLMLTAGDDISHNPSIDKDSLCGLPFWTPSSSKTPAPNFQRATIGGIININDVLFLLTAAHIFYPNDYDDRHDDDDGNDNDNDNDSISSDISTVSSPVTNTPTNEASSISPQFRDHISDYLRNEDVFVYRRTEDPYDYDHSATLASESSDQGLLKKFGYLSQELIQLDISFIICPELDWALVSPHSLETSISNTVKTPAGKVVHLDSVSPIPPDGSAVVVAAGTSGIFGTQASERTEGIILPGSMRMQEVWTINSSCQPGDCGSLVFDAQHDCIYGMVVATSSDAQETYLVPAKDIFDSLKAEWWTSNITFSTRVFGSDQKIFASRAKMQSPPNKNTVAAAAGKGKQDIWLPNPPSHSSHPNPPLNACYESKGVKCYYCCDCDHGPQTLAMNPHCAQCGQKYCGSCTDIVTRKTA